MSPNSGRVRTLRLVVEEVVVLGHVGDDAQTIRHFHGNHVFWVQQGRNPQLCFSDVKRLRRSVVRVPVSEGEGGTGESPVTGLTFQKDFRNLLMIFQIRIIKNIYFLKKICNSPATKLKDSFSIQTKTFIQKSKRMLTAQCHVTLLGITHIY